MKRHKERKRTETMISHAIVTLSCVGCGHGEQYKRSATGGVVLAPVATVCPECDGIMGAMHTFVRSLTT